MTPGAPSAGLRRLVEAVRDHARFAHPAPAMEIVETHISVILLTGPCAYKFKKPLDLGFLDFSTLAARKRYCEEELRLNRRLAPRHYLEVVPITGSPERPAIGGPGPAIEYAVRMVQFPREMEFDRLAARGALTPELIDRLAARIEAFHREAAVAAPGGAAGSTRSVCGPALANFPPLYANLESGPGHGAGLRELEDWTRAQCEALGGAFELRLEHGRVRDCHGDMHLGNMVLHDGEIVIFDCIEFSEELRWLDVISETAFVAMDLEARGYPGFAWRFLNAYLERGGDYAGAALWRFYVAYRALVRAKIASIRMREPGLAPAARESERASCLAHIDLAAAHAAAPAPALLVTHGVSGSGKTRLAQGLLQALGAIRIRSDVERKRLHGLSARARTRSELSAGMYSDAAGRATYAELARLADLLLDAGHRVIVDAAALRRGQRERLLRTARARGVPCLILDVQADPQTLRRRVAARAAEGADASEADPAVLDAQLARREPLDAEESAASLAVETAGEVDVDTLAARIRARLGLHG